MKKYEVRAKTYIAKKSSTSAAKSWHNKNDESFEIVEIE